MSKGRKRQFIQPPVAVGQVWRDYDYRRDRLVEVVGFRHTCSALVCFEHEPRVVIRNLQTGRVSTAALERFNGDSKGYRYEPALQALRLA